MSDLYNRIEDLCTANGINITSMCKESGASRGSLTDLKMGRKQRLSADTLAKIANYFNVTLDYLLGREPAPSCAETDQKDIFARNLQRYMEQMGVDRKQLCTTLGLKYSTMSEWLSAKKYPRIDKIELLANYFGIKKSDLIEDKKEKPATETGSGQNKELLDLLERLTEEQRQLIIRQIKGILSNS